MVPTIQWTKEKFNEFNTKYFNGELVTPNFKLVQSRSFVGCVTFHISSPRDTMTLKMSTFYDLDEKTAEGTLLHEMCHIYFIQAGKVNENHGNCFRSLVQSLNQKYDLSISEYGIEVNTINPDIKRKKMIVYIGVDKSGRYAWFSSRYDRLVEGSEVCGCRIIASCISDDDCLQGKRGTMTDRKSRGYYFSSPLAARRLFLNGTNRKVSDNRAFDVLMAA